MAIERFNREGEILIKKRNHSEIFWRDLHFKYTKQINVQYAHLPMKKTTHKQHARPSTNEQKESVSTREKKSSAKEDTIKATHQNNKKKTINFIKVKVFLQFSVFGRYSYGFSLFLSLFRFKRRPALHCVYLYKRPVSKINNLQQQPHHNH